MPNVGVFNNSPTAGGVNGTLVSGSNPVEGPPLLADGAEVIGEWRKLAVRTLNAGAYRSGSTTLTLVGATASAWQLAPDSSGAPGTPSAWGAPLVLAGPLENTNIVFWIRSRALDSEDVTQTTEDVGVLLLVEDDVMYLAGRSLELPYGVREAVGRSLALPSVILNSVGRSLALPYEVQSDDVGRSLVLPYIVHEAVGRSLVLPYGVTGAVGRSLAIPYEVRGDVSGFAVTSIGGTTVNLGWSAVAGAHHYKVERATDSGFTANLTTVSDAVTGTSLADAGLTPDTIYYYRITAHDASHGALSGSGATCGAAVQRLFSAAHTRQVRGEHATFATARSGGGTNTAYTTDHTNHYVASNLDAGVYLLDRPFGEWDTSAIPSSATISQAWLRLTGLSNSGAGGIAICKGTYSNSPAVAGDFAAVTLTDLGGPTGAPTVNTPTDYALTSPNTNLVKNGTSRLVLLERSKDYGNSAPSGYIAHEVGGLGNATADYRPRLKVSYGF